MNMNAVPGISCHRITAALLLLNLAAGLAQAETQDDQGLWFLALGCLGNVDQTTAKLRWWLDVQARFANDADGFTPLYRAARNRLCD